MEQDIQQGKALILEDNNVLIPRNRMPDGVPRKQRRKCMINILIVNNIRRKFLLHHHQSTQRYNYSVSLTDNIEFVSVVQ